MDIITLALARQSAASAVAGAIQGLDNIYAKKADVPALKHHHDVSDIMVATKTGGAYAQNLLQMMTDAYTTAMLKSEVNSVITDHTDIENVNDFMKYFNSSSGSPITTSDGKTYCPVMQAMPTVLIWPLIAGTAPMSSVQFGDLAQIPCNFDGQDLSQMIVIPTENKISFQLLSHKYPGVEDHLSADEWISLLRGNLPEEQSAIDEFCTRFGEQTATLTIQRLDDDGQPIDPAITGYETTLFEHDATSWGIYIFTLIPAEHMEEMSHIPGEEALLHVKFSIDEIEPESILTETPLIDTLHEMNTNIDKLKTDKINIDRVCKITYNTYGGPYSGSIGSLFGMVPEIDGVHMGSASQASIGERLVGNNYKYEYQDRFKIGYVFQKEVDENEQVTYRYLGKANELNGLEYTCGKDYDMEEPLTERFINSIRKAWTDDTTGEIDNNKIQSAGSLLNDDAFMFITILDGDLYSSIIYGFWKVENNSAYIDIKEIIPEGTDTSYEWLNDMINNTNNAASQAQSTANQANTTAQSAQSTAESAQSTANQANTTAQSAQSTAESAQSTANNVQIIARQNRYSSLAEGYHGVRFQQGDILTIPYNHVLMLFSDVFLQKDLPQPLYFIKTSRGADYQTIRTVGKVNNITKYDFSISNNTVILPSSDRDEVPFGTLTTGLLSDENTTIDQYKSANLELYVHSKRGTTGSSSWLDAIQTWATYYNAWVDPAIGKLVYFKPNTIDELKAFINTADPTEYFDEDALGAFTIYAERRFYRPEDEYALYNYHMIIYTNQNLLTLEFRSDIVATKPLTYIYQYMLPRRSYITLGPTGAYEPIWTINLFDQS